MDVMKPNGIVREPIDVVNGKYERGKRGWVRTWL
jgi:hypothetical protein